VRADYSVFVDESFYKWFGLPTQEANLCYGGLSLPSARLPDLERFETAIRKFALEQLPPIEKARQNGAEVKHSDFRHFSPDVIDEFGRRLDYFLTKNGAYIFGFFIPAEGFMNYKLRSDFIDDAQALKFMSEADYQTRIESIKQEMLQEWTDAEHNLGLLSECYKTFFGFIMQFQGRVLGKSYRVIYDSRNPDEDALLHKDAEAFAILADRATPGVLANYRGYETASSAKSAGLRLVDWIAGEVRAFFYRNPDVMSSASSFDILSPYWNPKMLLIEGRAPFYRRELSVEAVACFKERGRSLMLPQIKEHFASGNLTYYAKCGEARHISIPELAAYDMAD
jgi:hypothetical protein